ncbi:recombinase RecA [candidate division WOR-3 bacterium]|nr:recombinase RecA [candidate division WOR-3 bacterium]
MSDQDKEKALDLALKQIEKQFGKGTIMRMGEGAIHTEAGVIPTGSISLDAALGIGGVPRGRVVEIFGKEASGKTTIALHIVSEAQKLGGVAAFIDVEHALDPVYSRKLGVNVEELLISQPDTGEQALEIAEMLTRSGAIDVIVVDSVAALVPKAEIEGEMGDAHMGLRARLMSQALRKLTAVLSKSSTCAIFVNQIRYKIGVVFGNPMTTPGGLALKFHSSIRLDIRSVTRIKKGEEIVGNRIVVRVVKNKLAPPFKDATFDIIYGEGISKEGEILDLGTELGVLDKSGTWFSFGDTRIGQGKENARLFLKENKDLMEEILSKIKETIGLASKEDAREKEGNIGTGEQE